MSIAQALSIQTRQSLSFCAVRMTYDVTTYIHVGIDKYQKRSQGRRYSSALLYNKCHFSEFAMGFGHGFGGFHGYGGGYGHKVSVYHFINKTALCIAKGMYIIG